MVLFPQPAVPPIRKIKGLPLLMMALSFLMVSKIAYPSTKALPLERAKSFQALLGILLFCGLAYGLKDFKELIVFGICLTYLGFGVFVEVYRRATGRKPAISQAVEEEELLEGEADDEPL